MGIPHALSMRWGGGDGKATAMAMAGPSFYLGAGKRV
jgi:hypothetical protein